MNVLGVTEQFRIFYDHTAQEFFIDSGQKDFESEAEAEAEENHKMMIPKKHGDKFFFVSKIYLTVSDGYQEVVNGTSVFTKELLRRCSEFKDFKLIMKARVKRVVQKDKTVDLEIETDKGND